MDATEFKPGDLVRVKSGGPIMTVEQVGKTAMLEEDAVWCVWFEKVGNKQVARENTGNKRGHGSAGSTGLKMGQSC